MKQNRITGNHPAPKTQERGRKKKIFSEKALEHYLEENFFDR